MKDKLKQLLTIEDIHFLVEYLGGEPQPIKDNYFISRTICHHSKDEYDDASYKLYYYQNDDMGIFHCYSGCDEPSFDIFELVSKVEDLSLYQSILFVNSFFNNLIDIDEQEQYERLDDWDYLEQKGDVFRSKKPAVSLKHFNPNIINNLPQPIIKPWIDEGMSDESIKMMNIRFNPVSNAIVIPHYDVDGNLIGIRERTLVKANEAGGKYKPTILNREQFNHPLGYNLYGLNLAKENIAIGRRAVVFEGEKSCLKYLSIFGKENNISVASCGSSLSEYQVKLLLKLGVTEIIIGFDKQFKKKGDAEFLRWIKKLKTIGEKYNKYCTISFLFDTNNILQYKMSPIDNGKENFIKLFQNRLNYKGEKYM